MGREHRHSVLIVEDDRSCGEAVTTLLELHGSAVTVAKDGQIALDQLRQGLKPCVIVLDLMMPGKTGWQFREEQLGDAALAAVPVIVMSGSSPSIEKARQLRVGLQDFVEKPVHLDRLLTLLARHCPER